MRLFRKKRTELSAGQEKFAAGVADWILAKQRLVADWLNEKTADLDPKVWLFILILFCAGSGGYLIRLILQIFN